MLENIFRKIEKEGLPPFRAAVEGTGEVLLAVVGDVGVAGRHLPAGRVHDRLRAAVHLSVRHDDGVRHHGVAAREPHADADARRANAPATAAAATPRRSGSIAGSTAGYTRSLRWSLDHRGADRRDQPAGVRRHRSRWRSWSAGRSCRTRTRGNSRSPSMRRRGRRSPAWRSWCWRSAAPRGRAWRRPRDADDLRARQPLAHHRAAEADRRALAESQEEIAMVAREAMATYQAYRPTVLFRPRSAAARARTGRCWSISTGPICRLSAYAVQLNERLQTLPELIDIEGPGQSRQPGDARGGGPAAGRRPRRPRRRPGGRAAPDGQRRRRDHELPRGRRALSGQDAGARGSAQRRRRGRRTDGASHSGEPGAHRQRRTARARRRADLDYAPRSAVLGRRVG